MIRRVEKVTDKNSQYQLSAQVFGKHKFDAKSGPSFKTGLTYTMYTNSDGGVMIKMVIQHKFLIHLLKVMTHKPL